MPRTIPTYRRHPNGQAFVQFRGKRYYLGVHGSPRSKQRYREFLARLPCDPQPQPTLPGTQLEHRSIAELIVLYLDYAEQRYRTPDGQPNHQVEHIIAATRPLEALYGSDDGSTFRPRKLAAVREKMIRDRLARSTVNSRVGRIKRFFKWCCAQEYLAPSIHEGLRSVEGLRRGESGVRESEPVRPAEWSVVQATLPHLTPVVRAMVELQHRCGMRPGEVCVMRPCDLKMEGDVWLYNPASHKNLWRGQVRVVAIGRSAQEVLRPFLERATSPESYLFSPQASESWRFANRPPYHGRERKTKVYPCELRRREKLSTKRSRHRVLRSSDRYSTGAYRRAIEHAIDRADQAGVQIPH